MNQRQIESFFWAARLGSFAAAAARLNATQSTVSMRIQELENRLGTVLFDRTGRTARLTAQGALLLPMAEDVVLATARMVRAAAQKQEVAGYVRLGVAEVVALTWLTELVRRIRAEHPQIRLELEITLSHIVEEKLDAGTLDMAFATCEMPPSRFLSTPLHEVAFSWMCSPDLPGIPQVLTPQSLCNLPIIGTSREWQFRGSTLTWLTANSVHFRDLTICNSFRTAAMMAAAGLGLAYLPERLYEADVAKGTLRRLRCEPTTEPLRILVIRPLAISKPVHIAVETAALGAASPPVN
jgi:DNA-binding transcriptional LysR family regulator